MSVPMGRLVVITGPNGAGKTTLIETCLGLLKPREGVARLLGVDTRGRLLVKARRLCSYVPQDFMRPPQDHYTAGQVISMGLTSSSGPSRERGAEDAVLAVAEALGVRSLLDRPIGTLSGGEQQKVFIARALVRRPRVMFLDEPFASLDRGSRAHVASMVHEYVKREGATALVVSHDVSPLDHLADALVRMDGGSVVEARGL